MWHHHCLTHSLMNNFNTWFDKYFFVRERNARIVIVLASGAVGLTCDVLLMILRHDQDSFLSKCDRETDMLVRFVVTVGACVFTSLLSCWIYNVFKCDRR